MSGGNSKWPPSPIVFILSEHVAMYDNMPYGCSLAKIGNSKWPPGGSLSMKTMYICICSGFYKHVWIILKFGMQVCIGYVIIENENRAKKSPQKSENKISQFFFFFFLQVSGPLEKKIWGGGFLVEIL
jgi:hypothetical protein